MLNILINPTWSICTLGCDYPLIISRTFSDIIDVGGYTKVVVVIILLHSDYAEITSRVTFRFPLVYGITTKQKAAVQGAETSTVQFIQYAILSRALYSP